MNIYDILLIIVLAALVVFALWLTIRNRKKGKSCYGCMGDCSACGRSRECPGRTGGAREKDKQRIEDR